MADGFDDRKTIAQLTDTCQSIQSLIDSVDSTAFVANLAISSGVCWQFAVLGEAASRFSLDEQKRSPQFAWRGAKDFRNRILHEFDKINLNEIWKTAKFDAPIYLAQLQDIQSRLNER